MPVGANVVEQLLGTGGGSSPETSSEQGSGSMEVISSTTKVLPGLQTATVILENESASSSAQQGAKAMVAAAKSPSEAAVKAASQSPNLLILFAALSLAMAGAAMQVERKLKASQR